MYGVNGIPADQLASAYLNMPAPYQAQSEMESDWKNVNYHVAIHYQSRVKSIIEKSNFYVCFFVPEKISVKIRNEIEGDSFCAKKYIF